MRGLIGGADINERNRIEWLRKKLEEVRAGDRILDAGAGELRNRQYCKHLNYVSQDFCQYKGLSGGAVSEGLQADGWDTSGVDIISDVCCIPEPDNSFDVILCSEVLEHIPDPLEAIREFKRLLKPGGKIIITAPFSSNVHFAPFFFCTGFSRYWYEYHLPAFGFKVVELTSNGDWHSLLRQETKRLVSMEREAKNWSWPIAYIYSFFGMVYFWLRRNKSSSEVACFGWHCLATKVSG